MERQLRINNKVLIIAPHPDDEIPLAGQLIIKNPNFEYQIAYVTNGNYFYYEAKQRLREALAATKIFGIKKENIFFLGYSDGWKGEHLYCSENDEQKLGKSGRSETYALADKKDYCFQKFGHHNKYTRSSLFNDLKTLINDQKQDIIITCDLDKHADHKAVSLLVSEVLGEIFKVDSYRPIVLKRFAYEGVWFGPKDYYQTPVQPTLYPKKLQINMVRLAVDENTLDLNIKNNILYKVACCYKTQYANTHIESVCNSDIIYTMCRTDNLLLNSQVEVSSGDKKYLTDYKLLDYSKLYVLTVDDTKAWIPTDKDKTAKFVLVQESNLEIIVLYTNSFSVNKGIIRFSDGSEILFNSLKSKGYPNQFKFEKKIDIKWIIITVIEADKNAGFIEIEAFLDTTLPTVPFFYYNEEPIRKRCNIVVKICNMISMYLVYFFRKIPMDLKHSLKPNKEIL